MTNEVGYIKRMSYGHHGVLEISFVSAKVLGTSIEKIAEILNKDAEKREERVIYYPATLEQAKAHSVVAPKMIELPTPL